MPHIFPGLLLFFYWVYSGFIAPGIAIRRASKEPQIKLIAISRKTRYWRTINHYFMLVFLSVTAAAFNQIHIFGSIHIDTKLSLLIFGFLAVCMLLIDPLEWKFTRPDIKQRLGNYIPRTTAERLAWIVVSLVTAVSEEIVYRAIFFGIVYRLTGNYWAGAIASAFLFTVVHWHFGFVGMPSTFFVGLGLQHFVKLSGGLYIPIAIHFFHNVVNGIIYGELCKRTLERDTTKELSQEGLVKGDPSTAINSPG